MMIQSFSATSPGVVFNVSQSSAMPIASGSVSLIVIFLVFFYLALYVNIVKSLNILFSTVGI